MPPLATLHKEKEKKADSRLIGPADVLISYLIDLHRKGGRFWGFGLLHLMKRGALYANYGICINAPEGCQHGTPPWAHTQMGRPTHGGPRRPVSCAAPGTASRSLGLTANSQ